MDDETGGEGAGSRARTMLRREWPTLAIVVGGGLVAALAPSAAPFVLAGMVLALGAWLLVRHEDAPPRPAAGLPVSAGPDSAPRISARDLAAAVPYPLVIFEETSAIAYANDAAQEAFGPLQDGMSLLLKFRAPEMQELIGALTAGQVADGAVEYGERFPVESAYRVTGGAIGAGNRLFFLLFKDQSETRRIDRMRSDFIANASHELRTPLASISGFLETLRGPARNDPAARERFMSIMQEQTARMSRLIDDLLSLSRLEMRSHARPAGTVDLRQLLESVADTLAPLSGDLGVVVERDFPEDALLVQGDRDELFQVFANLLENACKYGQSGGRVVVSMSKAGEPPEACVTVRDFGPGIAEEHIPRLTERFYRINAESSRAQKGTGLGLAIVKHILTRHHGRLAIRSTVGEGAAFSVWLPLK